MSTFVSDRVPSPAFLKNPETSELGMKIISGSIELIYNIGFEQFTLKKLSTHIGSTEASMYRYYENKYQILIYLTSWYWTRLDADLLSATNGILSPETRLRNSIVTLTKTVRNSGSFSHIDQVKLNKIIDVNSSKIYLNKNVNQEDAAGSFAPFKKVVQRVSDIVLEINPNYKYPTILVATMIEGVHQQRYFAEHLPKLTNQIDGEDSVTEFYLDTLFKSIKQ